MLIKFTSFYNKITSISRGCTYVQPSGKMSKIFGECFDVLILRSSLHINEHKQNFAFLGIYVIKLSMI